MRVFFLCQSGNLRLEILLRWVKHRHWVLLKALALITLADLAVIVLLAHDFFLCVISHFLRLSRLVVTLLAQVSSGSIALVGLVPLILLLSVKCVLRVKAWGLVFHTEWLRLLLKLTLLLHRHLKYFVLRCLILRKLWVISLVHQLLLRHKVALGIDHLILLLQIMLMLKLMMRESCCWTSLVKVSLRLVASIEWATHVVINHLGVIWRSLLTCTSQIFTWEASDSASGHIRVLSAKVHLLKARLNLLASLALNILPLKLGKTLVSSSSSSWLDIGTVSKVLALNTWRIGIKPCSEI